MRRYKHEQEACMQRPWCGYPNASFDRTLILNHIAYHGEFGLHCKPSPTRKSVPTKVKGYCYYSTPQVKCANSPYRHDGRRVSNCSPCIPAFAGTPGCDASLDTTAACTNTESLSELNEVIPPVPDMYHSTRFQEEPLGMLVEVTKSPSSPTLDAILDKLAL
jgi:hypothetical protein